MEVYDLALAGGSRSKKTRKDYNAILKKLKIYFNDPEMDAITIHHLRQWQAERMGQVEAGQIVVDTVHTELRTIKAFFRWCMDDEIIHKNPCQRLEMPKLPKFRPPKFISDADLQRMLDYSMGLIRDHLIVRLLANTGCRVGGLISMRLDHIFLDGQISDDLPSQQQMFNAADLRAIRHPSAWVIEKGDRYRLVYFNQRTAQVLRAYLVIRPMYPQADVSQRLILGRYGPLQESGVNQMLRRLGNRAGVSGPHNPHAFRHAWARRAILKGMDLEFVSRLLGHQSESITRKFYLQWLQSELAAQHQKYDTMTNFDRPLKRRATDF